MLDEPGVGKAEPQHKRRRRRGGTAPHHADQKQCGNRRGNPRADILNDHEDAQLALREPNGQQRRNHQNQKRAPSADRDQVMVAFVFSEERAIQIHREHRAARV